MGIDFLRGYDSKKKWQCFHGNVGICWGYVDISMGRTRLLLWLYLTMESDRYGPKNGFSVGRMVLDPINVGSIHLSDKPKQGS